ncbi:hypothetical protein OROGR_023151 [Orobanche gracilis]
MMRYSSQTPQFHGYMPMVNENSPSVGAPEFPGFSTQNSPSVGARKGSKWYLPFLSNFLKSIRLPQSEPGKLFAKYQEGCRKDIKRAFGVLQACFQIIHEPARLWEIADLGIIMRSCIILHNMIVEDERDLYSQRWTDFEQYGESGSSTTHPYSTEVLPAFANHVRVRSELCDPNVHHELQADLVKHIWAKFGIYRD